ncbi:hypothetical protein ACFVAV_14460 [Nocardia sp. NPDC057663]|uniref:hypothetical protein n=1 Tax=Nocardia sp. NPDC057663 TaxID=3346201 RepID=UPI0036700CCE
MTLVDVDVDVDTDTYYTAGKALCAAADSWWTAIDAQWAALADCGSMCGSYEEATTWAAEYDTKANKLIDSVRQVATAADAYGRVLMELGYNHELGDYFATTEFGAALPPRPQMPTELLAVCRVPLPSAGGPGSGLSEAIGLASEVGITVPDGDRRESSSRQAKPQGEDRPLLIAVGSKHIEAHLHCGSGRSRYSGITPGRAIAVVFRAITTGTPYRAITTGSRSFDGALTYPGGTKPGDDRFDNLFFGVEMTTRAAASCDTASRTKPSINSCTGSALPTLRAEPAPGFFGRVQLGLEQRLGSGAGEVQTMSLSGSGVHS